MLLQFSVSNYRCFRERVTLNLAASGQDKTLPDNVIERKLPGVPGTRWLKGVALYGANASGKGRRRDQGATERRPADDEERAPKQARLDGAARNSARIGGPAAQRNRFVGEGQTAPPWIVRASDFSTSGGSAKTSRYCGPELGRDSSHTICCAALRANLRPRRFRLAAQWDERKANG